MCRLSSAAWLGFLLFYQIIWGKWSYEKCSWCHLSGCRLETHCKTCLTGRSHGPPAITGRGLEGLDFPKDLWLRRCQLGVVLKGMNQWCCAAVVNLRWNVTIIPLHGQQVLCLLEATVIRQPCLLSCVTYWKHLSKMWIWSAVQFLRLESKSVWLGEGWKYLSGWKGTVYLEVLVWRREDSETQWLGRERMSQAGVEEGCVKDWMSSPSCGVLWGAFVWGGLEKVAVPDIPFSSERPRLVTSLSQDLSFMIEEQGQTQPGPRLTGITKSYLKAAWVAYMQPGSQ